MRRSSMALIAGVAAATALVACDKPTPASYPVADDAAEATATAEMSPALEVDLTSRPPAEVGHVQRGDAHARLAYDGKRLLVELRGLPEPSVKCPIIAHLGQTAGASRWEHRFRTSDAASYEPPTDADGDEIPAMAVHINGSKVGGSAPRTSAVKGVYRFAIPTLPGDYALHVEASAPGGPCRLRPALPTVTGHLEAGGGLDVAPAAGPAVVGARAPDTPEAAGLDKSRYQPGDPIALVGHQLDAVTAVRFGSTDQEPVSANPYAIVVEAPPEGGDTDTAVVLFDGQPGPTLSMPVEGTVHRIGDAMGALSGAIWDTWLVVLLVGVGLLLTIVNGVPQLRGFVHALKVVRGTYDDPEEQGEITHFQALTAALSATVGLGNIAGVAVAVTNGGPGAVFWMWICGFLGMATKFTECTLSTAYRDVRPDGTVAGGPMYYMKKALGPLAPMAFVYALLITFASFGGGNMFQSNQAAAIWYESFGLPTWATGLILVAMVGLVIIGGIKRIGSVTDKLVPAMCAIYVIAALAVIFTHLPIVPDIFASIFTEATSVSAAVGGVLGVVVKDVIIQGFRRAAFSNEAGFGSAAIAHAAVKTDEPVREGVVALLEPFIDTVVICTMTALVILISGAWTQQGLDGVNLTATSFDSVFEGFGSVMVPIAVFLFAISTMISWSYYGEKGVEFLFGRRAVTPYRLVFIALVFVGAVWKLGPVLDFSDAMLGLLIVPNVIAMIMLIPRQRTMVSDYFRRLRSGEMKTFK